LLIYEIGTFYENSDFSVTNAIDVEKKVIFSKGCCQWAQRIGFIFEFCKVSAFLIQTWGGIIKSYSLYIVLFFVQL
jgi:hypothetical protein